MHDKNSVVYKLDTSKDGTTLAFVSVATRRFLTHDEAAELADIPELFVPVSVSGMKKGLFRLTRGTPMLAMGSVVDAGYSAFEDIDRLAELEAHAQKEKRNAELHETFGKIIETFSARIESVLAASNGFKLPFPAAYAAALMHRNEESRRLRLFVEKSEAREAAQKAELAAQAAQASAAT